MWALSSKPFTPNSKPLCFLESFSGALGFVKLRGLFGVQGLDLLVGVVARGFWCRGPGAFGVWSGGFWKFGVSGSGVQGLGLGFDAPFGIGRRFRKLNIDTNRDLQKPSSDLCRPLCLAKHTRPYLLLRKAFPYNAIARECCSRGL